MSHGKVKLFGIGVMTLAIGAEIYSTACGISVPDYTETQSIHMYN
jgi:hypothetical protein